MKKTIRILSDKIQQIQDHKNGTLKGGFSSLKGGFNDYFLSDNTSCSNTKDCTHATNTGTPVCSNTGTCSF